MMMGQEGGGQEEGGMSEDNKGREMRRREESSQRPCVGNVEGAGQAEEGGEKAKQRVQDTGEGLDRGDGDEVENRGQEEVDEDEAALWAVLGS